MSTSDERRLAATVSALQVDKRQLALQLASATSERDAAVRSAAEARADAAARRSHGAQVGRVANEEASRMQAALNAAEAELASERSTVAALRTAGRAALSDLKSRLATQVR